VNSLSWRVKSEEEVKNVNLKLREFNEEKKKSPESRIDNFGGIS